MSEKRFFTKINKNGRNVIIDKECNIELIDLTLACDVLNRLDLKLKHYNEVNGEQQATIRKLQDLCGQSDGENAKLRIENKRLQELNNDKGKRIISLIRTNKTLKAQLREKEEDEKLYANEILELRETNKEHIKFKSLGGNY